MNSLIVYHEKYSNLVSYVKTLFSNHLIRERESLIEEDYHKKDIIIVIGGDGTFLRASHLNKEVPMFGINPDPKKKVGFFTRADIIDYKEKLAKIKNKEFNVLKLLRLEAEINREKIKELCLNEMYIGDAKPYNMFNYDISINGNSEFQRSSGILVSTPAGSYSWTESAGGKRLNLEGKKYQFLIREPYKSRLTPDYKMLNGILDESSLSIKCMTPGILVMDSVGPEYILNKEDIVKIKKSSLNLILIET
jgi:NAD+ kinase